MTTKTHPDADLMQESDGGPNPYDAATYLLPAPIVAALMTNRRELLLALDPDTVSREHIKELLRLLGDMLDDRHKVRMREDELRFRLREMSKTFGGFRDRLYELSEQGFVYEGGQ